MTQIDDHVVSQIIGSAVSGDLFDRLVAMDLKTGATRWATGTIAFDNWSVAGFGSSTAKRIAQIQAARTRIGASGIFGAIERARR